ENDLESALELVGAECGHKFCMRCMCKWKAIDWAAMNSAPAHFEAVERRTSLAQSESHWQQQLRAAVTDADTLFDLLALPRASLPAARRAATLFPLRVPRAF